MSSIPMEMPARVDSVMIGFDDCLLRYNRCWMAELPNDLLIVSTLLRLSIKLDTLFV